MDVEMEDADGTSNADPVAVVLASLDMGYEDCAPMVRRGSMTHDQEKDRRASIKAVMADPTMTPVTKRRSIHHLMDGRRNSMNAANGGNSCSASVASSNNESFGEQIGQCSNLLLPDGQWSSHENGGNKNSDDNDMGYGDDGNDYGHHQFASSGGVINNEQTRHAEQTRPHCPHYDRHCTMIAPCCGAAFGCRICHDECPALPPKINNGGRRFHRSASLPSSFTTTKPMVQVPEDNHHNIDRFAVVEVICRECFTRQSSKTNNCVSCGVQFGAYHCNVCNLWMADEERPYHCVDCGFCRVGGQENFQHCHECGMCIDRGLYNNHNCKAGKYRSNCPVCQEFLFNSRGASHEMPCGHAIHWDCFRQLAAHDSRCPVCKKTAETRERMMPTWNAMAAGVAMQPIPPELARVVSINCNDCERSEDARSWHFLGMQCSYCSSFNTVVDRIHLQGEEAHEFLEMNRHRAVILAEQQQQQGEHNGEEDPSRTSGQPRRRVNRRRSAF